MAGTFLQLAAVSGTVDYRDNPDQAALASQLCNDILQAISKPKYDELGIVAWTLADDMKHWSER